MPQWFHLLQWGTLVAWVGAGVTIWKAISAQNSAKRAEAAARSVENEATWRITWGKPTITWGANPEEATGYWLTNMSKSAKYGVSVESPAGKNTFDAIPADRYQALDQKDKTTELFKVTWHVTAEKKDSARQVKVLPY